MLLKRIMDVSKPVDWFQDPALSLTNLNNEYWLIWIKNCFHSFSSHSHVGVKESLVTDLYISLFFHCSLGSWSFLALGQGKFHFTFRKLEGIFLRMKTKCKTTAKMQMETSDNSTKENTRVNLISHLFWDCLEN